jgi:hypothetical protein
MNRRLEGLALAGMAIGVATMLQPWWSGGMRAGFFLTFACTIGQIVFSHRPKDAR